MAEINWTSEAEQWLHDIHDYIAQDNAEAASRTVLAIYNKVQSLRQFPHLGYRYHLIPSRDIRILLFGHYKIAYLIKINDDIDILGIFHQALEIERYLF